MFTQTHQQPTPPSALLTADDGELLAAVGEGSQAAFAQLVARYYAPVYRVAYRMLQNSAEAEDLAQETFVKLWLNPQQIREAKALKGWLIRVGSNMALDRLRKKLHIDLDEIAEPTDTRPTAEAVLEQNAIAARINQALASLPERQRLAITLTYFEGLPNAAAAEVLDATIDGFESLLSRARKSLKQLLAQDWQDMLADLAQG